MFKLRKYQEDLIKQARVELRNHKSILIQGSTGMGKTVLSSSMLKSLADQNKRGLFICHRRELIKQTSDSFNEFNIDHSVIATSYKLDLKTHIQICSVLSLANKIDLIEKPDFIIWDEAHHTASATWSEIFNYFPDALHIGLTATPQRLDGKGLGKFFEKMIQAPPMRELINQGYLSDFDIYAPSQPDLEGIKSKNGDYALEELDKVVNKPTITGCAIEHYKKICNGKKAIVFCTSISHSLNVMQKFNDEGIKAAHIDGQMTNKQRDELIDDFKSGDLKVLSNVDIVAEGFDLPAIEVAILLRPTQSLTLYLQQVGRALRKYEGKNKAIILDHTGNVLRHGMPDSEYVWDLDSDILKNKKEVRTVSGYKSCPECSLVVNKSRVECDCGYSFKKNLNIIQVDGELEKFITRKLVGNCKKVKRLTLTQLDGVIGLHNNGYPPRKIANEIWGDKQTKVELKRNECVVASIVSSRTWSSYPIRPISKDKWIKKNIAFRVANSYRIDIQSGCWISLLSHYSSHPRISYNNKEGKKTFIYIKKYLYESHFDFIPNKYTTLNQCGNVNCVNPSHLKIITKSEAISLSANGNKHKEEKEMNSPRCTAIILKEMDTNIEIYVRSIREASNKFKLSRHLINKYKDTNKPYKGYLIKSYLPF